MYHLKKSEKRFLIVASSNGALQGLTRYGRNEPLILCTAYASNVPTFSFDEAQEHIQRTITYKQSKKSSSIVPLNTYTLYRCRHRFPYPKVMFRMSDSLLVLFNAPGQGTVLSINQILGCYDGSRTIAEYRTDWDMSEFTDAYKPLTLEASCSNNFEFITRFARKKSK